MCRRIATLFLIAMTIGVVVLHKSQQRELTFDFLDTIAPQIPKDDTIAHQEFLILLDQGDEKYLNDVLHQFDLRVLSPLGEWVHVIKNDTNGTQQAVSLSSSQAKKDVALLSQIEAHEAVHSVTLNYIQTVDSIKSCWPFNNNDQFIAESGTVIPQDPLFSQQWYLSKESGINLPEAWSITTGNPHNLIALVDRHFIFAEPDLMPQRCSSRQYYYENVLDYFVQKVPWQRQDRIKHGTHVLSVVAPCTDNAVGLAGIDWHAQVFAVDTKSDASFSARMFGILWASGMDVCTKSITGCPAGSHFQKNMHPANIINASFGFAKDTFKDPPYGPVLDVIGRINRQGRVLIASAGNEGDMADARLPGSAGGVISVGASNRQRTSAYFSNFGRSIDVLAPGENILGLKHNKPRSLNGTSFSAPIVAGVASLMLAANPLLSWKHIEYILQATATPLSCTDYCPSAMGAEAQKKCQQYCCEEEKVICAAGIVDAAKAVKMASAGLPNLALIDVDDYYIAMSDDSDLMSKVLVKNWGTKSAFVRMKKTNRYLKILPESFEVAPVDKNGIPGLKEVTLFYDTVPKKPVVTSLILEAANLDQPDQFHDQIEAIVEIVPDPKLNIRAKKFRALLPRR